MSYALKSPQTHKAVNKELPRRVSKIKALFNKTKIAQGINATEQLCQDFFEMHVGVVKAYRSSYQAHCYEHTLGRINDYELEKGSYEIAWQVLDFVDQLAQYEHTSPYLTPIPPIDADQVVYRRRDLLHIRALQKKGLPIVFLQGMSGMGKTTLCKLYIYNYIDEYTYVAWIGTGASLTDALVAYFFDEKNQQLYTQQYKQDIKLQRIIAFLQQLPGKKLLIADGLDHYQAADLAMFKALCQEANFDILISTTQPYQGDEFQTIGVEYFDEEQSSELFFKEHLSAKEDAYLPKLLGLVDYQPLMSRLLARVLHQYKEWNVKKLYKALHQSSMANTNWLIAARLLEDRPQEHQVLFTHVLTLLNIAGFSDNEKWVMKQFLLFPPFEIDWNDLKQALNVQSRISRLLSANRWQYAFLDGLDTLTQKGWLSRDKTTYKFHGILQEAAHYFLRFEIDEEWEGLLKTATNLQQIYLEQKRLNEAQQMKSYLKVVQSRYE